MNYGYINVAQVVVEILVPTAGAAPPLGITCDNPPVGTVGTPYSHSFPATGVTAPYTFSIISGLTPPGMMFDPSTGTLSGTPTFSIGVPYPLTIQVTDSVGATAQVDCSITITPLEFKITFRGVKRSRCAPEGPEYANVPVAPSVKRAM